MAPLYVTRTDFEDYVEGWQTDDAAALERLLERAERSVDKLFPLLPVLTVGTYAGRRFAPPTMYPYEVEALKRAVCAQAEYRFNVGEEALAGAQPAKVTGPDFTVENPVGPGGGRQRYSPKLAEELVDLERFRTRFARARA